MKPPKFKSMSKSRLAEIRRCTRAEIMAAAARPLTRQSGWENYSAASRIKRIMASGCLGWRKICRSRSGLRRTTSAFSRNRAQIKNETVSHLGTAYRLLANTAPAKKPAKPKESAAKAEVGESVPDSNSSHEDGGADVTTDVSSPVALATPELSSEDARDLKEEDVLGMPKSEIITHSYRISALSVFGVLGGEHILDIQPFNSKFVPVIFAGGNKLNLSKEVESQLMTLPCRDHTEGETSKKMAVALAKLRIELERTSITFTPGRVANENPHEPCLFEISFASSPHKR